MTWAFAPKPQWRHLEEVVEGLFDEGRWKTLTAVTRQLVNRDIYAVADCFRDSP